MLSLSGQAKLRVALAGIVCLYGLKPVSAGPPIAAQLLTRAVELYELKQYSDAEALFVLIDSQDLSDSAREQREKYLELTAVAIKRVTQSEQAYQQAKQALADGQLSKAEQLLGDLLGNEYAPIELQISARARLAGIGRLRPGVAHSSAKPSGAAVPPYPTTVPQQVDQIAQAGKFMEEGMRAIEQQHYQDAQKYFNRAAWYLPDARWEKIVVKVPSGLRVGDIPISGVSELNHVATPQHWVRMNLQFGVGRLLGVQTFGLLGGPQSGVGAPGFVQLPSISRTQIKTSVAAPAYSSASRSETIVQDFVVLFKPRLATATSLPIP